MPCWWQAVSTRLASITRFFRRKVYQQCAVVTSYEPGALSTDTREYAVYQQMLGGKSTEDFEKEIKKKFIEQPGQDAASDSSGQTPHRL